MSALFALIGFIVFAARRLLTYLHLFQQEEYDGRRFLAWLVADRAWDRRLSLVLAAIFVVQLLMRGAGLHARELRGLVGAAFSLSRRSSAIRARPRRSLW